MATPKALCNRKSTSQGVNQFKNASFKSGNPTITDFFPATFVRTTLFPEIGF